MPGWLVGHFFFIFFVSALTLSLHWHLYFVDVENIHLIPISRVSICVNLLTIALSPFFSSFFFCSIRFYIWLNSLLRWLDSLLRLTLFDDCLTVLCVLMVQGLVCTKHRRKAQSSNIVGHTSVCLRTGEISILTWEIDLACFFFHFFFLLFFCFFFIICLFHGYVEVRRAYFQSEVSFSGWSKSYCVHTIVFACEFGGWVGCHGIWVQRISLLCWTAYVTWFVVRYS